MPYRRRPLQDEVALTPQKMVEVLTKKLSKEEFVALFELFDEQDRALYAAIGDKAIELAPELFADPSG